MHQLNVLIFGPSSFISTINELKSFLKFNSLPDVSNTKHDVILFHNDVFKDKEKKDYINKSNSIKIYVSKKKDLLQNFDAYLELPTTLKDINTTVENAVAKKTFNKNSSIKIKEYLLDKNEKKLIKNNNFIILTEKEIKLLELFLSHAKPISRNEILSTVWNYSSDADTHTVETHIYRLRKKIIDKFLDEQFILNNKSGYYI
jgi:DNA-binding response OmpR family regulator